MINTPDVQCRPVALIQGRDGFRVQSCPHNGAYWLHVGHPAVVGGLFGEWSDCETDKHRKLRARRMIYRARRENPDLPRERKD